MKKFTCYICKQSKPLDGSYLLEDTDNIEFDDKEICETCFNKHCLTENNSTVETEYFKETILH